jgi:hypothetical protein
MAIRKNKKFIDPRYFMDEKMEGMDEELNEINWPWKKKPKPTADPDPEPAMDSFEQMMSRLDLADGHLLDKRYNDPADDRPWKNWVKMIARSAFDMPQEKLGHTIDRKTRNVEDYPEESGGSNMKNQLEIFNQVYRYRERPAGPAS